MLKSIISDIKTDWKNILLTLWKNNEDEFNKIDSFLTTERENFKGIAEILPPENKIFNAFNFFDFKETKIIIIGQDPYHQKGQANGLCFSVNDDVKIPPSLKQIFKEINNDIGTNIPDSGNLERWANQGILLLNTALTVRESKPGSHSKIWDKFTKILLNYISENLDTCIVLLWGNYAKKFKPIFTKKFNVLEANHPSPLSSNRGGWFGTKHFSKCNTILETNIEW